MNNFGLLAGLLCVALSGPGAGARSRQVYTMSEIFELAERNSAQLRTSRAAEAQAVSAVDVARLGRLPEIDASLQLSYNGDGFTTRRNFSDCQKAPIPHFGNALGVTVSQPVYAGGAITNSIKLAQLKSEATRFQTELRRDGLRLRLAGTYIDIYRQHNLLQVVESNIAAARTVLDKMLARYEQGTVLRNDITRYELMVSNLELEVVRINNTLDILNSVLVTDAGLPADVAVVPDTAMLKQSLQTHDLGWWQVQVAEASPALNLARAGVSISRKAEELVRAEKLPKVGLQAGWSINGPILTEVPPINRNMSYWYVGVGVSYNISSLYKNQKTAAQSRAATLTAEMGVNEAADQLQLEVRADYIRYLQALEVLKSRTKAVELAERNYNTISTRYAAGMALITDLLDAASARLDAQNSLVDARVDIIYQYYKLLFTTSQI